MNSFAVRLFIRNCARCVISATVSRTFVSAVAKAPAWRASAVNGRFFASEQTSTLSPELKSKIDQMVKHGNSKVVVFMKGIPDKPKCGFSNAVVQVFRMHGVDSFDAYDVLASDELRQGIKEYSDWPTVPQVFIDGDFVGGCDILLQMHRSGELIDALNKVGIKSKLEEEAPSS